MPEQNLIDLTSIRKEQVALEAQKLLHEHYGSDLLVMPEGYDLKSMEKYQQHRNRMRAEFRFNDLAEWAGYIHDQGVSEGEAICMINQKRMSALAVLDHGSVEAPLHCEHKAELALEETPEYASLMQTNGDRLKQKALAEWIEDWAHCICGESTEAETMDAKQLAHSVRKITVDATRTSDHETSNFGASRSALEKIEAKNKERMPAFIFFTCKPYDDLTVRTFKLRVSAIASNDDPLLVLRVVGLEIEQRSMAQEFKNLVKGALDSAPVKVYVGT